MEWSLTGTRPVPAASTPGVVRHGVATCPRAALGRVAMALTMAAALTMTACSCQHEHDPRVRNILPATECGDPHPMHEARYTAWPNPDSLIVMVDGKRCMLAVDGVALDQQHRDTIFKLKPHGNIDRLYFLQMARDFFAVYSDNRDEDYCHACRIDLDDRRPVWSRDIGKCSMIRPIVRGQFCYLVSCGAIGKMRLKDGQFDWHHEDLNQGGHYEQFAAIDLTDPAHVLFLSPRPFEVGNDTIEVSDITGEILRMDL